MNSKARWIGWSEGPGDRETPYGEPAVYLFKNFSCKHARRAVLRMSALGLFVPFLNGKRVGEDELTPGWTNYRVRRNFFTYDVTDLLREGENRVGAVLGDGWYTGNVAIYKRQLYGTYPLRLWMELEIETEEGKIFVVSDEDFRAARGRVGKNDILNGEFQDARVPHEELFTPGFPAESFAVSLGEDFDPEPAAVPPARCREIRSAKEIPSEGDGRLFDFGQNMVGNVEITLSGEAGSIVQVRYGEMLTEVGGLYVENLRSARCTDTYTLKGEREEAFCPLFTFHGFRYIEVIVLAGRAEVKGLKGKVIFSDLERTGHFSCSDPIADQVYRNALWGQKGNFLYIPTDCPQRDERMGWTGDTEIFCKSAMYNMDCRAFYRHYLDLCRDDQRPDGAITDVVPYVPVVGWGCAAWGDVICILPWQLYRMYGDLTAARENLAAMKAWVNFLTGTAPAGIRAQGGYGDWLSVGEITDTSLLNTAFYAHSVAILSELCKALGDPDARTYAELFERVRAAFRAAFLCPDGTLKGGDQNPAAVPGASPSAPSTGDTQTAYLLAAQFGLMSPEEIRPHLLRRLKLNKNHLATGFLGVSFLLPVLSELGEDDLCYELMTRSDYPSWGYSVKNGATTIWERWNSYTREEGFGDVGMNSFNHYSLGSCTEWMFERVLGINPGLPGFEKLSLRPMPDFSGKMEHAEGSYRSVRGEIRVSWTVRDGACAFRAEFPKDMPAEIGLDRYRVISLRQEPGLIEAGFRRD